MHSLYQRILLSNNTLINTLVTLLRSGGNYHHSMFHNPKSGTYDEMSGYLGRWLSMTTAMGVYKLVRCNHFASSRSFNEWTDVLF